ncbi:MAG TPA: S8 family serine peptidase [Tepidisphaeraceae bacterium]|nr:S8 family serine peptidase [Tepidisphaeraceae bacterium]
MKRQPTPATPARQSVEPLETRTMLAAADLAGGTLTVRGTDRPDVITVARDHANKGVLVVTTNGDAQTFSLDKVRRIRAYGGGGSDVITVDQANGTIAVPAYILGQNGNDSLTGGGASDTLIGGNGNDLLNGLAGGDQIFGGAGGDRLLGGDNVDVLHPGAGDDLVNSGAGKDVVVGAGKGDQVDVGEAADVLISKKARWRPQPERGDNSPATPAAYNATVVGYTPDQVRAAYQFGRLSRKAFTNRGQGQTIAIVTAYDYRTAREDLNVFSRQFGLPEVGRKMFGVMYADGVQPVVNALWASEAALDLQWAHAIAPAARLVLVEAASDLPADMFNAVAKATKLVNQLGGGVVSMSFGFSELQSDAQWETQFKNIATDNVSFVAAAGNVGGQIFYPAASEEVLAVGGTTLPIDENGIRTGDEAAWADGGGGSSAFRDLPDYQSQLQIGGNSVSTRRALPDVAYNADPSTAYAVFNSTPNENGDTGWQAIAGTSAGAPQWAGIVALVNQKREANGLGTMGNDQLHHFLYGVARKNQQSLFTDITLGDNTNPTFVGFDLATGWGSPKAEALIDAMSVATAKNRTSSRGIVDFVWNANFTRELLNGLLTVPAVVSFGGEPTSANFNVGNARFTPSTISLRFQQQIGELGDPRKGTITLNALLLPRTGNTFEGNGTGIVLLNDGTPGIFNVRFKGRLYRLHGQDKITGEFYAVDPLGQPLQNGPQPNLRGVFDSARAAF